jgi:hypothetical protein
VGTVREGIGAEAGTVTVVTSPVHDRWLISGVVRR